MNIPLKILFILLFNSIFVNMPSFALRMLKLAIIDSIIMSKSVISFSICPTNKKNTQGWSFMCTILGKVRNWIYALWWKQQQVKKKRKDFKWLWIIFIIIIIRRRGSDFILRRRENLVRSIIFYFTIFCIKMIFYEELKLALRTNEKLFSIISFEFYHKLLVYFPIQYNKMLKIFRGLTRHMVALWYYNRV